MSWALVDRSAIHAKILEDKEERSKAKKVLVKEAIFAATAKPKIGDKTVQVVLRASLLCRGVDCSFDSDISHCTVCSRVQTWHYMREWYRFQARRLSREEHLDIVFESCSYPRGSKTKGRYTHGLFKIRLNTLRTFETSESEDGLLPPVCKEPKRHNKNEKSRNDKTSPAKSQTCTIV